MLVLFFYCNWLELHHVCTFFARFSWGVLWLSLCWQDGRSIEVTGSPTEKAILSWAVKVWVCTYIFASICVLTKTLWSLVTFLNLCAAGNEVWCCQIRVWSSSCCPVQFRKEARRCCDKAGNYYDLELGAPCSSSLHLRYYGCALDNLEGTGILFLRKLLVAFTF